MMEQVPVASSTRSGVKNQCCFRQWYKNPIRTFPFTPGLSLVVCGHRHYETSVQCLEDSSPQVKLLSHWEQPEFPL